MNTKHPGVVGRMLLLGMVKLEELRNCEWPVFP